MKIKRIFALILMFVLSLMMATQLTPIFAKEQSTPSLEFALSSNGKQVVMANHNDVITVSFTMQRTDSNESYTINGFQNYIYYDLSFFEFVEGSIVCNDTGSATAKKQNSITYGEIIQCQNMGKSYESTFVFCSFQLKIIGTSGSGMVYCGEVQAFDTNHQGINVSTQNLQVLIDIGCNHESKTKIEAKSSNCNDRGWDTYYACDNCDATFDSTGNNMIPGIPYLDVDHSFGVTMFFDKLGHWYACVDCGERSQYSAHTGGTATCAKLAVCAICSQKYGTVNKNNHSGETIVKNEREPNLIIQGYTGDIHCADCDALLEKGEAIATTTLDLSSILLIILFIILLLIVVVAFPPAVVVVAIILLLIILFGV